MQPGDMEWAATPTSSQFGAMIGVDPYKSRPKVWAESTGRREDISNEPAILHGVEFEPVARRLFIKQTGISIYTVPNTVIVDGFGATPDGLTIDGEGGLEIKCPYSKHDFESFKDIDSRYYPQIFGNMMVFGAAYWYFAVFITDYDNHGLRAWKVLRNDMYIYEMRKILVQFRNDWWGKIKGPPRFKPGEKQKRIELFTRLIAPPKRIL